MKAIDHQYKVLLADSVQGALEAQRVALGFHSANSLSSVYLTALSSIPANKVWEALSTLNRYQSPPPRKSPARPSP